MMVFLGFLLERFDSLDNVHLLCRSIDLDMPDKPKPNDRVRNGVGCALILVGPLLAGLTTVAVLTINSALGRPALVQLIGDLVATFNAAFAALTAGIGGFLFQGPLPQRVICAAVCTIMGYLGHTVILSFGGPIF